MLTFICTALLLIGLAIPMCLRRIGPNRFYGFRTRHSMEDEKIWYATNVVCGWWLVVTGSLMLIVVVVAWLARLGEDAFAVAETVAVLVGCFFCAAHPLRVQRRMLDEREFDDAPSA